MYFKRFEAQLMEINNFLPLFPGYDPTKKIPSKELNEILLHAVPNGWGKHSYLRGWYFEMSTYRETCAVFDQMEISKQVYTVKSPSKNIIRADANCDSHVRK